MAVAAHNLYMAEKRTQRVAVAVLLIMLGGSSLAFQNQRSLFDAPGAAPVAPAALTAFVTPTVESDDTPSRILRIPRRFVGLPQLRREPVRSGLRAIPANLVEGPSSDPETDRLPVLALSDEPNTTDIPGIVTEDDIVAALDTPPIPRGTVELAELDLAVAPVPEPSTWVMLIAGFMLIGGSMRRSAANRKANLILR